MNSWEIIKKHVVKRETKGSTGRLIELNAAADLFVELSPFLSDSKAESAFNADDEVRKALLSRSALEQLKEIT